MTTFTFTATDINRDKIWSWTSTFATREEALAYAAKVRRNEARQGRNVTVEVA